LQALPRAGPTARGEAALLALEYGSDFNLALRLFRLALLDEGSAPMDRTYAAAVLALLNTPWSEGILVSVLREASNLESVAQALEALRESPVPAARRGADEWERVNPHRAAELKSLRRPEGFFSYQMQQLHDRVLPLRPRVLPAR
jgi:hypothetical protein